jgi:hypothetical protein
MARVFPAEKEGSMRATVRFATAAILAAATLQASGPIAVYALVDKVTIEPSADKAERIRVSGVFIIAAEKTDQYSAPQSGFLYFTLPAQNTEQARREWTDLQSVAGTHQVVGLGSSWFSKATVHKPGEEAQAEAYPMGNGMVKVNSDQPRAKALLDYKGQ